MDRDRDRNRDSDRDRDKEIGKNRDWVRLGERTEIESEKRSGNMGRDRDRNRDRIWVGSEKEAGTE